MGTDKVVIVVKDGMVQEVFGSCPYKFDVEVLDMDFNGADPDAENSCPIPAMRILMAWRNMAIRIFKWS